METFFLDPAFRAEESDIPAAAAVRIENASKSRRQYDQQGVTVISHDCASYSELDQNIDRLIAELDSIRQKGKRMFEEPHSKFLKNQNRTEELRLG